jgi:hypothetical protein
MGGNRIPDTGYRIPETGYRIPDTGYRKSEIENQETRDRRQVTGPRGPGVCRWRIASADGKQKGRPVGRPASKI